MPRIDISVVQQVTGDDLRLLQAVELGMKNHEVVGEQLIIVLSKVGTHGSKKCLRSLVRRRLLAYVNSQRRQGYRLTFFGYDCLALNALRRQNHVQYVGNMIGTGKESDIYIAKSSEDTAIAIKFTRLGRRSFRQIRVKRDYHDNRSHISWLYLSRISARKEHSFMQALHGRGFAVPQCIAVNRHCVVMEYIEGVNLCHVAKIEDCQTLYEQLIDFIIHMAECGLIHCDFNEFNILITSDCRPVVIDFPQAISTRHPNAAFFYDRDLMAIVHFFRNRFHFTSDQPLPELNSIRRKCDLDVELKASGYKGTEDVNFEEEDDECDSIKSSSDSEYTAIGEEETQIEPNVTDDVKNVIKGLQVMLVSEDDGGAQSETTTDISVEPHIVDTHAIQQRVRKEWNKKLRRQQVKTAKMQSTNRKKRKNMVKELKENF